MHYYDGLLLTHNHVPCCLPIQAISVSFRVVTPGGSLDSQEGRTPNVAAKFFFFLLFPTTPPPFLPSCNRLNSSPLQPPPGDHYDRVSGNASKKIFWSNFPGGAQRFARGGGLCPPPGRMPEWNTVRLWKADADVPPGTPHVVVFLLRVVQ
jgi:hypothetical protein